MFKTIIRDITIFCIIFLPLLGALSQLIFKPLKWITFFKVLFVWNAVFFAIACILNYTRVIIFMFDGSNNARIVLISTTLFFIIASLVTFYIEYNSDK
jgi:hypothetical protein